MFGPYFNLRLFVVHPWAENHSQYSQQKTGTVNKVFSKVAESIAQLAVPSVNFKKNMFWLTFVTQIANINTNYYSAKCNFQNSHGFDKLCGMN